MCNICHIQGRPCIHKGSIPLCGKFSSVDKTCRQRSISVPRIFQAHKRRFEENANPLDNYEFQISIVAFGLKSSSVTKGQGAKPLVSAKRKLGKTTCITQRRPASPELIKRSRWAFCSRESGKMDALSNTSTRYVVKKKPLLGTATCLFLNCPKKVFRNSNLPVPKQPVQRKQFLGTATCLFLNSLSKKTVSRNSNLKKNSF